MSDTGRISERPPERYGYLVVFFALAISGLGAWVGISLIRHFGLSFENDYIPVIRLMIGSGSLVFILPGSVLSEFLWAHWKHRKFHLSGVLAGSLFLLEFVVVMFLTATIFDLLFPGLYFTREPFTGLTGLVLGLIIGLPMIAMVLTIRIPKVDAYMKKAFE